MSESQAARSYLQDVDSVHDHRGESVPHNALAPCFSDLLAPKQTGNRGGNGLAAEGMAVPQVDVIVSTTSPPNNHHDTAQYSGEKFVIFVGM